MQSWRMAFTTTTFMDVPISAMNDSICLSKRSTESSRPVLSKVVIASVAMELKVVLKEAGGGGGGKDGKC